MGQRIDRRTPGFHKKWVSGSMLWSVTAKRLIGKGYGEDLLAIVALYLAVHESSLLVSGNGTRIPGDPEAAKTCPYSADELQDLDARLERLRHEVMHLADMTQPDREISVEHKHELPYFTFRSTIGNRDELGHDAITRPEIESILDKLDVWLAVQYRRIVLEEFDESAAQALREKIDRVMSAVAAEVSESDATGSD